MVIYKVIFFVFPLFYSCVLFGQQSSVIIEPVSDNTLLNCIVVLSDEEGNIIVESSLKKEEIINGTTIQYNNRKDSKTHFTIVTEYGDSLMAANYAIKAVTYYNIDPSFQLTSFVNPNDCIVTQPEPIQLIIDNAREVEWVHYYFPSKQFKNLIRDRSALKLNFSHQPEEDLFLVFECNTSPYDRYVYVPSKEIKDKLNFNLLSLPSDLQELYIDLPAKQQWLGTITGTNLITNSLCRFYSSDDDPVRLDTLKLLLPSDQIFDDFTLELGFEKTDPYSTKRIFYTGLNKKSLRVPELNENLYNVYDFIKSEDGISCTLSQEPDLFHISMIQYMVDHPFENQLGCTRAYWSIIGRNETYISFQFPKMSSNILNSCDTRNSVMGGWSVGNTSLIKVVDKKNNSDNDLMLNYRYHDRITVNVWFR